MQKNTDIVNKGVSFNKKDPEQKKYLDHAMKRTNFSAYVKRLIQRDCDGDWVQRPQETFVEAQKEEVSLNTDLMGGLI